MNLTPTIGLVEAIWTSLALIAIVYHYLGIRQGRADQAVVRREKQNSIRGLMAGHKVRVDSLLGAVQMVFAFVGFLAMTRPPQISFAGRRVQLLTTVVFVGAEIILVYLSWDFRRVRAEVVRLLHQVRGENRE